MSHSASCRQYATIVSPATMINNHVGKPINRDRERSNLKRSWSRLASLTRPSFLGRFICL